MLVNRRLSSLVTSVATSRVTSWCSNQVARVAVVGLAVVAAVAAGVADFAVEAAAAAGVVAAVRLADHRQ
jgi:hypothetical protein